MGGRKITGTKIGVPFAEQSHRLLVPARLTPAPPATSSMIVSSSGQITPELLMIMVLSGWWIPGRPG